MSVIEFIIFIHIPSSYSITSNINIQSLIHFNQPTTTINMYTSTILLGAIALTGVFAAPATTTLERRIVSRTTPSVVTHTVAVGRGGLHFEPDNVVAEIGEIVEFHYLPKNHSVAQSSFDKPCVPLDTGAIFSGFQPTTDGQSKNVFQVEIKTKAPLWFYCSQPVGQHCKNGMNMAVNQVFNSNKTLREYRAAAALTGDPISPAVIGGGLVIPNPNPLAGL
jgi:plastocyanin